MAVDASRDDEVTWKDRMGDMVSRGQWSAFGTRYWARLGLAGAGGHWGSTRSPIATGFL